MRAVLTSFRIVFTDLLGVEGLSYAFVWAYIPGVFPFGVVAVAVQGLSRMSWRRVAVVWSDTGQQIAGAAVALVFGVAMVQVMLQSGNNPIGLSSMMRVMAEAVAGLTGSVYLVVAPLVGVLGSFMTGSNTVSNILFTSFQYDTALILGLPAALMVVLQVVGGAVGNMVCVNNIVAVSATVGLQGAEGTIIRRNIGPCLVYSLLVALFVAGLVALGVDPTPPG